MSIKSVSNEDLAEVLFKVIDSLKDLTKAHSELSKTMSEINTVVIELTDTTSKRFKLFERQLMKVDSTLDDVFVYFNKLEKDILEIKDEIAGLRSDVDEHGFDIQDIRRQLDGVWQEQRRTREELTKLDSWVHGITNDISEIYGRIVKLETQRV